jgi:hypothetical protein
MIYPVPRPAFLIARRALSSRQGWIETRVPRTQPVDPVEHRTERWEADVPLSDHEQRLLDQMERALYEEDPKFASQLRGADLRAARRRRLGLAVVGFVIGLALMLGGVITKLPLLSVLGFVQMLVSVTYVVSWWGKAPSTTEPATRSGKTRSAKPKRTGFMDSVEERWRRRRDGDAL